MWDHLISSPCKNPFQVVIQKSTLPNISKLGPSSDHLPGNCGWESIAKDRSRKPLQQGFRYSTWSPAMEDGGLFCCLAFIMNQYQLFLFTPPMLFCFCASLLIVAFKKKCQPTLAKNMLSSIYSKLRKSYGVYWKGNRLLLSPKEAFGFATPWLRAM